MHALNALGEGQNVPTIFHHRERFKPDTPDIDWIGELANERDWIIISGDPRITRNPVEKKAWLDSGITGFFLGWGWASLPLWQQASVLLRWWPQIIAKAKKFPRGAGFIAPVKSNQFIELSVQALKAEAVKRVDRLDRK